jgi:hypothetical protein
MVWPRFIQYAVAKLLAVTVHAILNGCSSKGIYLFIRAARPKDEYELWRRLFAILQAWGCENQ